MVKAIIFDCFGVVVSDAFGYLIDELKLSRSDVKKIANLIDKANKGLIKPAEYRNAAAKLLNISPDEYRKRMSNNVKSTLLLQYIKELRRSYKIGMLSNVSSMASLESRFDKGELTKYFDVVVASAEIGYAKPEAQAYEITASELGVRLNECIMVDDREEYCDGAKGVGMNAVLYVTIDKMKQELKDILSLPYEN